ncbi:cytochrome P450 [Streptomyces celluloflavus]|uniref:cytochrome P450 n=1 Tax=Streptomyces celluloflavus TaxID=58344 RepID=UPI00365297AC
MPTDDLPPFGLRGWPAAALADPYPVYLRYREKSPVHYVPGPPDEPGTHYVFGYDQVAEALSSQRFGRSAAAAAGVAAPRPAGRHQALHTMIANWLVFLDPPRHTALRSRLSAEFTPKVVLGLRARIRDIAGELLAGLRRKDVADLVAEFAAPFPVLVICELLGIPGEHRGWLRERSVRLQEASTSRAGAGPDGYARAGTAARELRDFFGNQIRQRRDGPTADLISLLVREPGPLPDRASGPGGPLSDDEIAATCVHLLTAGHETTTHTLAKSVLALLDRPGTLAELCASPSLLPGAVHELVRFDSPVQAVSRWAYQDVTLGRHCIRRGSKVMLLLGSANRDPRHFARPDVLDIHRPPDRHLGFGLGIHYCLGAALARAEVEIGLAAMLEFLPDARLAGRPVPYADDLVFHGPAQLWLRTGGRSGRAGPLRTGPDRPPG